MKKAFILLSSFLLLCVPASACPLCNKQVMEGIYNSTFYPNLGTMLLAFIVITVIVIALSAISTRWHRTRLSANPGHTLLTPVPLITAATVLGIGLGGFADGIVLHQILQVHAMLSNKVPNTEYIGKSVNMFWDGVFHFFCLVVVITGVILLWKLTRRRDIDRSGKLLAAGLLGGWGIFNIVEGIIDHHLLKLHNVIEFSPRHDIGNYSFLAFSVLLLIIALIIINRHTHKKLPPGNGDRLQVTQ